MYLETIISFSNFTLRKYRFLMLFLLITLTNSVLAINEIKTVGNTGADYSTLKAAFAAVNSGTLTGNVTLRIVANTTETTSALLNASGNGSANYSSVIIYPTLPNLTITGTINSALIDLNGADNVVFDGRVNAVGTTVSLSISNLSNSNGANTSTFRFVNDANNNVVKYCQIKGSETNLSSGVLFFSTTTELTGNDNNTISNCEISSSTDTNRPVNVIYSEGSPGSENNNNNILNNTLFNFFSRSTTSNAINLSANSTAFSIINNSFFETATFIPTADVTYSFISINNSIGSGFQILNNCIGGSAALCGGIAWKKTNAKNNAFNGIYLAVGTDSPTLVEGNKISNFDWNNRSNGNWTGILVQSGEVNIGSSTGNIIGETSGTSSVIFNSDIIGPNMNPIQINSTNNVSCIANKIGSISAKNARYVICINKNSDDGNTIINNNTIGSTVTSASIEITTAPLSTTQFFVGIHVQGANNTVKNNNISNLTSNSTGNGNVRGIEILSGSNNVSNNVISKIANASTNSTSLIGLSFSNSCFDNTISANIISELENTNAANINGSVSGMSLDFTGTNLITKNFIHDIYVPSAATNTKIYGIRIVNGIATYSNNIIKLGTTVRSTIYGIYDSGQQDGNMYHNTVYINGNPTSGSLNSYAFYSASNANTINYLNNIFVNARSNSGASGKNYAAYFAYSSVGSLTLNYNVYFTSGIGGVLGFYASTDKVDVPIVSGQDANSLKTNPGFLNENGINSGDYKPVITKFVGVIGTGVNEDFGGALRTTVPTVGAWEFAGSNMWKGFIDTDWGNALNWTLGTIPATDADITFDPYPLKNLVLDITRSVNSIINNQSTYLLILNGKRLTLKGALNFTNGAQIDATATASMFVFSGSTDQYLNAANFVNGSVYNIRLNNPIPVIVSGNLTILGSVSTGGGRLDANTNTPTITFSGSNPQFILNSIYLTNKIYNLVVNNTAGLTINAPLIVSSTLTINNGKLLTLSPIARLNVNGTILNNAGAAGFVLNSASNSTASLIHNTNNVLATARRYIGGDSLAWHFLSSPIRNQSLSGDWKPTGSYSDGTGYDLYVWDEPANCWVYNLNNSVKPTWNAIHASTNFISGKGYLYAVQAKLPTKQFVGQLNNGNIAISVSSLSSKSFKGFNLVGNPYPSSIDWKNNAGFTRNMLETTGGGYNIWIWSYTAQNYGVYNSADPTDNGTNNITRYISPHMGFFVKAASDGTFVFKNAARVSNQAADWLRVKAIENPLNALTLKVNSIDSIGSDEIKLNFGSEFTQPGAGKMFSPAKSAPSLFIKNDNQDFTTFYLTTIKENPTIELGFKAGKDGKYTINATEISSDVETLILEDKLTGKIADLQSSGIYTFTSKTTDKPERFNIHFSKQAMENFVLDFANVYSLNHQIYIDLNATKGDFKIKILDIKGMLIKELTAVGGEQLTVSYPTKGVVFVQLYSNEKSKTFKLLN